MKFNESWLREWVDPSISSEQLAEQLTMAGLEVEAIESVMPEFTDVVVARVENISPHPQADRLNICSVDYGEENNIDIVCGADNVRVGHYYPFAKLGSTLPGGVEVSAHEIKGVVSNGMLCSESELGLSNEAGGLFELSAIQAIVPGVDLNEFLRLDDTLIELSLTPNRGDCLSLNGIAREVGVLNQLDIQAPAVEIVPPVNELVREIQIDASEACPRYVGRIIKNIDIHRPSPTWLTEKLRRCGIRSINPVVDISNYVMLELGQPTHAFDNDKLNGTITVRYAKEQEELMLLDEQSHQMPANTLVIADDKTAVAMAGIMGGLETAVSDSTRDIFLESAFFTPIAISGRARQFGLHTDASHRYERGVDYELQSRAVERVSQLVLEICGGEPGPTVDVCSKEHLPENNSVVLEYSQVGRLLGQEISAEEVVSILERLGLSVTENDNGLKADIPSFRFDLTISEDLIEEIARIYGYPNIPSVPARAGLKMKNSNTTVTVEEYKRLLVDRDYHETITYSFVNRSLQSLITGTEDAIALLNPISADMEVMRRSLWPGLLQALQYNLKRQQQRVRLFEHGLVFSNDNERLVQTPMLSGLIQGESYKKQWGKEGILCDFFDIKADVEALLNLRNKVSGPTYERVDDIALHPGRSAEIIIDNQSVGKLGAVHPAILQKLSLTAPIYLFELEYQKISSKNVQKFTKISKFPSIKRDISIIVDRNIAVTSLTDCVEKSASKLLQNLELFDVYQGEGIDIKKKSLTLGLTFQGSSSTLIDEEVEDIVGQVLGMLHSEFGATLRE